MNMKILVFLHGTIIVHKNARGLAREEIVKQVVQREESVHDYPWYIPIGNAPERLRQWQRQGAKICYLSSHRKAEDVESDTLVLKKYAFPDGQIFYRREEEQYRDVVERIRPLADVVVEDDCESIGGETEMVYPNLRPELRDRIKSIIVKEFGGIDHLPDEISGLMR